MVEQIHSHSHMAPNKCVALVLADVCERFSTGSGYYAPVVDIVHVTLLQDSMLNLSAVSGSTFLCCIMCWRDGRQQTSVSSTMA